MNSGLYVMSGLTIPEHFIDCFTAQLERTSAQSAKSVGFTSD